MGTRSVDGCSLVFKAVDKPQHQRPSSANRKTKGRGLPLPDSPWYGPIPSARSEPSSASVPLRGLQQFLYPLLMVAPIPTQRTLFMQRPHRSGWPKEQQGPTTAVHLQDAPRKPCEVAASPTHVASRHQGDGGKPAGEQGEKTHLIYRIYQMGPFFTTFQSFWENSRFLGEAD